MKNLTTKQIAIITILSITIAIFLTALDISEKQRLREDNEMYKKEIIEWSKEINRISIKTDSVKEYHYFLLRQLDSCKNLIK